MSIQDPFPHHNTQISQTTRNIRDTTRFFPSKSFQQNKSFGSKALVDSFNELQSEPRNTRTALIFGHLDGKSLILVNSPIIFGSIQSFQLLTRIPTSSILEIGITGFKKLMGSWEKELACLTKMPAHELSVK